MFEHASVPVWLITLVVGAGTFALGVAVPFMRRTARRWRADDDPSNDAWADLLDSIADARERGDPVALERALHHVEEVAVARAQIGKAIEGARKATAKAKGAR